MFWNQKYIYGLTIVLLFVALCINLVYFTPNTNSRILQISIAIFIFFFLMQGYKNLQRTKQALLENKRVNHIIKETQKNLLELNKELEFRIQEAVKRSQEKQQLLYEQSKLAQIGELISMLAHQWRQPLSAISTTIATAKMQILLENFSVEEFSRQLDRMEDYTMNLSKTIDDFRSFFKPHEEPTEAKLLSIINATLKLIQNTLDQNGIEVIIEDSSPNVLLSFENELLQVFLNLFKNSIDALERKEIAKPKIWVTLYEKDDLWYIEIEDNAQGIDPEIIDKIFEPYFSTKKERNGTGLGLYMTKPIIEKHCVGNIFVENGQEGARFTISLPSLDTINRKMYQSL